MLGISDIGEVKKDLNRCGGEDVLFELYSKETLLSENGSHVFFTEEFTDVKGQSDFELGLVSDIFIGNPFS